MRTRLVVFQYVISRARYLHWRSALAVGRSTPITGNSEASVLCMLSSRLTYLSAIFLFILRSSDSFTGDLSSPSLLSSAVAQVLKPIRPSSALAQPFAITSRLYLEKPYQLPISAAIYMQQYFTHCKRLIHRARDLERFPARSNPGFVYDLTAPVLAKPG